MEARVATILFKTAFTNATFRLQTAAATSVDHAMRPYFIVRMIVSPSIKAA
jgi:hypothetical protein